MRSKTKAVEVAASLWSVPRTEQKSEALRLARNGLPRWHWDVADGSLGPAGGFTPDFASEISSLTKIPSETHLMIADPVDAIPLWASFCDRIAVHIEIPGYERALEMVLRLGRQAIVAISPDTPASALDHLSEVNGVLVMSVRPGHAGAGFWDGTYARLRQLRRFPELGVDGSVNVERGKKCVENGATWLVSGTDLCAARSPTDWLTRLQA